MKKSFVAFPALILAGMGIAGAQTQAPSKVGIIAIQQAILATKDGQKAQQDLQEKFSKRKTELEQRQNQLNSLQDQLKKGAATMSDAAKAKLQADIENMNKSLTRDGEDFDSDVQQEEQKLMNDLGAKMMDVVTKYATQNGLAMVIDVSNQQTTPVLWADQSTFITEQIVKLYDQAHPGAGAAPAPSTAKPAATPTSPAPAAPKPVAPKPSAPAVPRKQ